MIDLEEVKEYVYALLGLVVFVLFVWVIIDFCIYVDEHSKIKEEWQIKVNNCVLNENSRNDCKLILYRDKQIHEKKINNSSSSMNGAIVGGMIGASMGKR